MVSVEYANAYSEVLEILEYISQDDYSKIPEDMIKMFETNRNPNYKFKYDINKTLNEQNVSTIAKIIIAILFRDYWANDTQREKILSKEKYDRTKLEKEKQEKYNPNDIFKNCKKNDKFQKETANHNEIKDNINSNLPVELKKESLYNRMKNFLKNIFHI